MTALQSLLESRCSIVVDASVAINLNASAHAAQVIRACPNKFVVSKAVVSELKTCSRTGRDDSALLNVLIASGDVTVVELGAVGQKHFENLVIGSARETLDDGEAATIGYALETGSAAIIDERKARRICNERFPSLTLMSTVQILCARTVLEALGKRAVGDAISNALSEARMQVAPSERPLVAELIGPARAVAYLARAKTVQ